MRVGLDFRTALLCLRIYTETHCCKIFLNNCRVRDLCKREKIFPKISLNIEPNKVVCISNIELCGNCVKNYFMTSERS